MPLPVFLDTCVLYPATLCDTLLRIAATGAYSPFWSQDVLDELRRNLIGVARMDPELVDRRLMAMNRAFPEASVTGYRGLVDGVTCDPRNRHVVAAAARARCAVVVTYDVEDFPIGSREGFGLEVVTPDEFLLDQFEVSQPRVRGALQTQVGESDRPDISWAHLLGRLERSGLRMFVNALRRVLPSR